MKCPSFIPNKVFSKVPVSQADVNEELEVTNVTYTKKHQGKSR